MFIYTHIHTYIHAYIHTYLCVITKCAVRKGVSIRGNDMKDREDQFRWQRASLSR